MTQRRLFDAQRRRIELALRRMSAADWYRRMLECGEVDRTVKGRHPGAPWLAMERLALRCTLDSEQARAFLG